jgi:hypothetical protein
MTWKILGQGGGDVLVKEFLCCQKCTFGNQGKCQELGEDDEVDYLDESGQEIVCPEFEPRC